MDLMWPRVFRRSNVGLVEKAVEYLWFFDSCHHCLAAENPYKYEHDSKKTLHNFIKSFVCEN